MLARIIPSGKAFVFVLEDSNKTPQLSMIIDKYEEKGDGISLYANDSYLGVYIGEYVTNLDFSDVNQCLDSTDQSRFLLGMLR